jgi:hypothetical protein
MPWNKQLNVCFYWHPACSIKKRETTKLDDLTKYHTIAGKIMPRSTKCTIAALLYLLVAGFMPLGAQNPDPEFFVPEFFVSLAPSVVTVTQGEAAMLTVTIRCNTSSFAAVKDCNARPKFDLSLSEFPDGTSAQIADGRIGDNTVSIASSSEAKAGSFPVQIKVTAGTTTQVQTFVLNIRGAATTPFVSTIPF